jgi:FKBP-type peptidyl-prolyl cis-trans isomerase FkpA
MRTRTTINFIFCSLAATALLTSCHGGGSGDFKTDASTGVSYRFINHDENGAKPADGSFGRIIMLWTGKNAKGDADSVYLDTHKRGGDSAGVINIPLKKSFNGCLEQGIMMMAKGDSAVFQINADSLFMKTFHAPVERIPKFITPTTMFTFQIKLVGFQTQQEMMAERQAEMQKRMQAAQANKTQEPVDIAAYIQKNYPNAKPDADSIFLLETVKGKGKQVKEGDSISVGYTGMFLNGTVFDKSDNGPGHRTLNLLYSKNMALIKGWISVLAKMHQGDKVKVLIPSAMAYGPQGRGQIPAYAPLIFDMELVSVKSN